MIEEEFRPYAATANVLAVIQRARTRNLPEVIDNDFLALAGIPETVYGRVRQALEFLDLVQPDQRPTEKLHALAKAPDAGHASLLAECVRDAYRDDFDRVSPEQDNQTVIMDAFRRYQPRSQTMRMVMLFLGLCRAAAIPVTDAPRERKMQSKSDPQRRSGVRARARVVPLVSKPYAELPSLDNIRKRLLQPLFEVTESDIAVLDQDEFDEVWSALGKVARARARAARERSLDQPNSAGEAVGRDNEGAADFGA